MAKNTSNETGEKSALDYCYNRISLAQIKIFIDILVIQMNNHNISMYENIIPESEWRAEEKALYDKMGVQAKEGLERFVYVLEIGQDGFVLYRTFVVFNEDPTLIKANMDAGVMPEQAVPKVAKRLYFAALSGLFQMAILNRAEMFREHRAKTPKVNDKGKVIPMVVPKDNTIN